MTEIRVFHVALTALAAVGAVFIWFTNSLLAALALPAGRTQALARRTAASVVLAVALLRTVHSVGVQRALVHAHFAHVARRALASAGNVVAGCIVVALAGKLAVEAVAARGAFVRTNIACPAGCALAGSILWITFAVVLAATVLLALGAMLAVRAAHVASDGSKRDISLN